MSNIAIRAENVSKLYRIGARSNRHDTLRDHLVYSIQSLFSHNEHSDSHGATSVAQSADRNAMPSASGTLQSPNGDYIWALKDVSFEIKQGEVVGFIGRNGAGKSTLLKILSRITKPTAGRVEMFGRVGALLEVGTGFQGELTGRENIYLSGAILGMKKNEIDRRFDEIVAFSEIEKFIDTPVKRYSSGMAVRLGFAVAAHLEPEILIVDEVLAVGDASFQQKCLGKIGEVAQEGRTVLFVSHNVGAVRSLCTRCLLIESGLLALDGPQDSVTAHYLSQMIESKNTVDDIVEADPGRGNEFRLQFTDITRRKLSISCGDPIVLEFQIDAPVPLAHATVGITLMDMVGGPVISMSSKVQNVPVPSGTSRLWSVCCELGVIPLNAGTYTGRVYVGEYKKDLARFTNAFTIKIIEKDVFGWGKTIPGSKDWGNMYWAPSWNIKPVKRAEAEQRRVCV